MCWPPCLILLWKKSTHSPRPSPVHDKATSSAHGEEREEQQAHPSNVDGTSANPVGGQRQTGPGEKKSGKNLKPGAQAQASPCRANPPSVQAPEPRDRRHQPQRAAQAAASPQGDPGKAESNDQSPQHPGAPRRNPTAGTATEVRSPHRRVDSGLQATQARPDDRAARLCAGATSTPAWRCNHGR